jgi:hypothetical protein
MKMEFLQPDLPNVSVVATSPGLQSSPTDVVVTVPTFRRPGQLLETLASIRSQATSARVAIIVMENDADGREGATAAAPLFASGEMTGMVIIAHERGNCCAYNAGWLTALSYLPLVNQIAIIDDDEIADPDWLGNLLQAAETLDADILGGPQVPIFPAGTDPGWHEHPVFAPPYARTGRVPALYSSGNLLISTHVLEAMERPFLDLKFNFMGGGDSDFLSRAAQKGFTLGWCAEAVVRETIPARRLEADWIRARSLRNGVISTLVETKKRAASPFGRVRVLARTFALLAAAPLRGAVRAVRQRSVSAGLYPVYVAAGRLLAEFGYMNEQYRDAEKN